MRFVVGEWTEYGKDANVDRRVVIRNGQTYYFWRMWSKTRGTFRIGCNTLGRTLHDIVV